MPIEIPTPGRVQAGRPTLGSAPDSPRSFFAGRGIDVPLDRTRATPEAFGGGGGMEAVNRSIQGVIGNFRDKFQQVQEATNSKHIVDAAGKTDILLEQLKQDVQQRNSPEMWFSEFQRRAPEVRDLVLKKDEGAYSPGVSGRIDNNFTQSYSSYAVRVLRDGETTQISQARETGVFAAKNKFELGHRDDGIDVLNTLVDRQLISPTARDQLVKDYDALGEMAEGRRLAATDAEFLLERLEEKREDGEPANYRNMSIEGRNMLERLGNTALASNDAAVLKELDERLKSGDPSLLPTPDYIMGLPRIPERAKKRFIESYYDKHPRKQDIEEVNEIEGLINNYDPNDDAFGFDRNDIEALIFSSTGDFKQEELFKRLDERLDETKRAASQPKVDMLKWVDSLNTSGLIGTPVESGAPNEDWVKNQNLAESMRIKEELIKWWETNDIASNPEARELARKKTLSLIKAPQQKTMLNTLGPSVMTGAALGSQAGTVIQPLTTAYRPAPKGENAAVGLNERREGGEKDAHGNKIWGNTTMEDYLDGKGDYVTVAMDKSSSPFKRKAWLASDTFPGVVFRVMDNGGFGNGKTGTGWVDIAYRDPTAASKHGVFDRGIRYREITEAEAKEIASPENRAKGFR